MTAVAARVLALAFLVVPMGAAAQTPEMQRPRPGGAAPSIPEHVRAQLWPERQLTPVEQELKDHVTVLSDSLVRIDATGSQIARQTRAGASAAIVRSSARTLAGDCSRAGRVTGSVSTFAAMLTTSDAKWGEPAVRGWRSGLAELTRELARCERSATAMVEGAAGSDGDQLQGISARAGQALLAYRRTEGALLRTLKISIDPLRKMR